jgi:hypothetical protein
VIEDRWNRPPPTAARPVLVVGMAPSRSGHCLDGPTFERLAAYAGATAGDMALAMDFVNLLPEWPGYAVGSPKWDEQPDPHDWAVGARASLLAADLAERPRRVVVGLGGYVRAALTMWWELPKADWLSPIVRGPGSPTIAWSPHPAGTSMWWNDPAARNLGESFWHATYIRAHSQLPLAPKKVPLIERTRWLLGLSHRFMADGWPAECVDWPFLEPRGRPQALSRGASSPAAHLVLELTEGPRPSKEHQALHSCDRGEHCVNAAHLRWGTELDNRMDMVERSRGSIGKIGLDGAREIVREFDRLVARLAEEHGVTKDAVLGIALGKSWDPTKWTRRL